MISLIIFDLDGVLTDSRELHYEAMNRALKEIAPEYVISRPEHLSTYDGLSTTKKLQLLSEKGLDKNLHNQIWKKKQDYTTDIIRESYVYDERVRSILRGLKDKGYTVYVASNCIYDTLKIILLRKGFMEYIDYFMSNQDVVNCKPNPEIYFKCMCRAGVGVKNTVVVEDSHIGREAVLNSGAHLYPVENPAGLNLKGLLTFIKKINKDKEQVKWQGYCNVVIPMAGLGSRFEKAGYSFPKPLIDVHGKPMIQLVVENLGVDTKKCRFIFIVREEHINEYHLRHFLTAIAPNSEIVVAPKLTEGSACSILLAKQYINNNDRLIIANSDQFVEWDPNVFLYSMITDGIDGGITTFTSTHPKFSFAKLDEHGFVDQVAEKDPISNNATTGIYYWAKGSDFVRYAEEMIGKNIRVNNEFYTCPVYNEAIRDGKKIRIFPIDKMWCLGTPEDLQYFLSHYPADKL